MGLSHLRPPRGSGGHHAPRRGSRGQRLSLIHIYGADLSAEVLVLPHHGSAGSLLPELYDAVRPQIAIASAGAYNAYRLPSRRVREELARRNIPLRVTGEEGEIHIRWNTRRERGLPSQTDAAAFPRPVSYTHLDVYKRQGHGGAQGRACGQSGLHR